MLLRSNSLDKMNDPRENQPWSFGGINVSYENLYSKIYTEKNHIQLMYNFGNEVKKAVQIISFVNNDDQLGYANEIMWTHYAKNHKGLCLEIDEDIFIEENIELLENYYLKNINYGNYKKIWLNGNRNESKSELIKHIIQNQFNDLFLLKSEVWKGEHEKRLLLFKKKKQYLSIANSLTGIYLGLVFDNSLRPKLYNLINNSKTEILFTYYEDNEIKYMKAPSDDLRPLISKI